ncbi:MAG: hypothetical protein K2P98_05800, partial [Neisseriaceae bacterium]|nr:hypothetical protein [Neisseriaceae bacterium]
VMSFSASHWFASSRRQTRSIFKNIVPPSDQLSCGQPYFGSQNVLPVIQHCVDARINFGF